ncbi:outer membrane beta-barrel protein [Geothrix sp. SG200]|uniref:outer membrane beta-barrel protein n=1 Tax=Geothrix sp. SG200 TaxID=2922865 RepID=UPI001FAC00D8|nr:outer membrane beta-barrel protein [Geothrix sp. SG200]
MTIRALILAAAALVAPALSAQEGPRFGLQAGLNIPQSDLKDAVDSKVGFTVGAQATFDLRGGHMIRHRLDYTWFPEYSWGWGGYSTSHKFSNISLGADYLYFVEGKPQGFYVTGGLALVQWKAELSSSYLGASASASETTTKLGLAAGVGYQFNKTVGADVRYLKSSAWEGDLDMIQVGATFCF